MIWIGQIYTLPSLRGENPPLLCLERDVTVENGFAKCCVVNFENECRSCDQTLWLHHLALQLACQLHKGWAFFLSPKMLRIDT